MVEIIKGQSLNLKEEEIYNPDFWIPYLPINAHSFRKIGDKQFTFKIDDQIVLDPTGTLTTRYQASGELKIDYLGQDPQKGGLWHIEIHTSDPQAYVKGNIRAKNIPKYEQLKIGIFLHQIEFDETMLDGFGRDAVIFAIRLYLRKLIQGFHKQ